MSSAHETRHCSAITNPLQGYTKNLSELQNKEITYSPNQVLKQQLVQYVISE